MIKVKLNFVTMGASYKTILLIKLFIGFAVLTLFSPWVVSCSPVYYENSVPQSGQMTFQVFYDELSPYGHWSQYSPYGYVWIPDAGPDFFPYLTNGYWVWSDFGWTWMSGYPWGWAPFHYGRWDFNVNLGWFWVPDNVWGPCWVTWRRANEYYGWSPMRPGISMDVSFRGEFRDVNSWCFVRDRDFLRHNLNSYYINRRDNDRIIGNSIVITNTFNDTRRNVTYVAGPHKADIQSTTSRRIASVTIRDNERPGERLSGKELRIYRPQIENVTNRTELPAPRHVTDIKDIRSTGQSNSAYRRGNTTGEKRSGKATDFKPKGQPERNTRRSSRQQPEIQKPAPDSKEHKP
jgi:hypothetical protein